MEDMNFYNKHYIRIREDGCITDGFSDAFRQPTETDICINEKGGYQFRLHYSVGFVGSDVEFPTIVSEENPTLFDWDGMIPLYKYEDGEVVKRTEEEIEADRAALPVPEYTPTDKERIATLEEQLAESDAVAMALYEASLEQQTVNAEQDAAILGLYEMIGG